jgi:hypothetical protein
LALSDLSGSALANKVFASTHILNGPDISCRRSQEEGRCRPRIDCRDIRFYIDKFRSIAIKA